MLIRIEKNINQLEALKLPEEHKEQFNFNYTKQQLLTKLSTFKQYYSDGVNPNALEHIINELEQEVEKLYQQFNS